MCHMQRQPCSNFLRLFFLSAERDSKASFCAKRFNTSHITLRPVSVSVQIWYFWNYSIRCQDLCWLAFFRGVERVLRSEAASIMRAWNFECRIGRAFGLLPSRVPLFLMVTVLKKESSANLDINCHRQMLVFWSESTDTFAGLRQE